MKEVINIGDAVRVRGHRGVAFTFLGFKKVFHSHGGEPDEAVEGGYWDTDFDTACVQMVGDDRVFEVDFDAMTALATEDFCADCGQIGCPHGRYR